MMKFKHKEDEEFFRELLRISDKWGSYKYLFDFCSPTVKRKEFNSIKKIMYKQIKDRFGEVCLLNYPGICNPKSGFVIDHIIPLSSNKLNKELRKLKPLKGKKVLTQSLGSNNILNLIIACKKCNSYKKHKLERSHIINIMKIKISQTFLKLFLLTF